MVCPCDGKCQKCPVHSCHGICHLLRELGTELYKSKEKDKKKSAGSGGESELERIFPPIHIYDTGIQKVILVSPPKLQVILSCLKVFRVCLYSPLFSVLKFTVSSLFTLRICLPFLSRSNQRTNSVIELKHWHQKPSQREATCYYWLKASKFWEELAIKCRFLMALVTKWPSGGAQQVPGIYRNDTSRLPGHFPSQPTIADCISASSKAALMQHSSHTKYGKSPVQSASDCLYELKQRGLEKVFAWI